MLEPQTRGLGNVLWLVDLNRQSLDRVVPVIKAGALEHQFEAAGWQVLELKYGRRLREAFARDGGELLRRRIDEMPNQLYQSLFGASDEVVVEALLGELPATERRRLGDLLAGYRGEAGSLIQDLGGHDLADILDALASARARADRPTIVFAYTIKGYRLPIAGRPLNHSMLLTGEQIDGLRGELGLTPETEWDALPAGEPGGAARATTARARLERPSAALAGTGRGSREPVRSRPARSASTQEVVGRVLLDLSRVEGLAERVVTVSPDVSVSTNLGGWINKVGVFGAEEEPAYEGTEASPLAWRVTPRGRHIELGISEMNLFLALGQLGLTREYQREQLFPIGALYDPFVARGLDALIYGLYSGSRFVVLGTPSGISLSREGGAHQSHDHPVDRPRASRARVRRADVRARDGVAAARRAAPPPGAGRRVALSAPDHEAGRRRGRSPTCAPGGATKRCGPTCSPGRTGCGRSSPARTRSSSPPAAP